MITSSAVTVALAVITAGATYAGAFILVQKARARPAALAAPLALAAVVCFEALVLQVLSLAHAVTRGGVLLAHGLLLTGAAVIARRTARDTLRAMGRAPVRLARGLGPPALLVVPLLAVLVVSATRYAPNNWDSMTYHLARVAHWMQRASVEAYPTNISRQLVLGPGAEYLLLVLQVISGSDRLANFLQLFCYALLVVSAPWLARLAGARKGSSRWAAVIAAAIPMAVLQATSTQNDLVAAVLAVAIIVACTPFLHGPARSWWGGDVLLLATTGAAAVLVKPVAVISALPFVVLAGWRAARCGLGAARRRDVLWGLATSAALVVFVAGPPLVGIARDGSAGSSVTTAYTYPLWGDWKDRSLNVVRGLAHHVPAPRPVAEAIGLDVDVMCRDAGPCTEALLRPHEDYVGNPAHALLAALLLVVAALRWHALGRLARTSVVAVVASWIVFHAEFRDNAWVSRLQTPLFAVCVASFAALGGTSRDRLGRAVRLALPAFAVLSLAYGYSVAIRNQTRPPLSSPPWAEVEHWSYYANRSESLPGHDEALAMAGELGCRRLGLYIDGDSYDYPLTWRAMTRGIEVRHVVGPDAWPCLVFTDRGMPPVSPDTTVWLPTGSPSLVVNARALAR